jgi:hypothetical protein
MGVFIIKGGKMTNAAHTTERIDGQGDIPFVPVVVEKPSVSELTQPHVGCPQYETIAAEASRLLVMSEIRTQLTGNAIASRLGELCGCLTAEIA